MLSIIYIMLFVNIVFIVLIFILFYKLSLNQKIGRYFNFQTRYDLLSILLLLIVINFTFQPNILNKIEKYQDFKNLNPSQIDRISLNRTYSNKQDSIQINDPDSIKVFIDQITDLDFSGPQRPSDNRNYWEVKIFNRNENVTKLALINNSKNVIVKIYDRNSLVAYYKNKKLKQFFNNINTP